MAYIEPNTDLVLCENVPLDPTYEHTWWFPAAANGGRETQFNKVNSYSRDSLRLNSYSYQRKDVGVIKVERPIADVVRCNYMAYRNSSFENKWFYAFIDRVEYINDKTSAIYFTIDVLMTWYFDYEFDKCWIERQHQETDVPGDNLIPENLETGEYVIARETWPAGLTMGSICVIATFDEAYNNAAGGMRGNIYSGLAFNYFDNANAANAWLTAQETITKSDGIVAIMMIPNICRYRQDIDVNYGSVSLIRELSPGDLNWQDYTPRNKKLLTYPYTFCYVTNLQGNASTYPFEYFKNREAKFRFSGCESANPGVLCLPLNYKGVEKNWDELMTLTGYPQCAANVDAFKAWVGQNAGTITARGINLVAGTAAHIVQGAKAMDMPTHTSRQRGEKTAELDRSERNLMSDLQDAVSFAGQAYDHYIKPPQAIGSDNANILFQAGATCYMIYTKNIKIQMAMVIDDFFDKYGYAIHRVGKPNVAARPCWTFVKTAGCTINGSVPADDTKIIEQIHDKGITYWRYYVEFCNYSQTNTV